MAVSFREAGDERGAGDLLLDQPLPPRRTVLPFTVRVARTDAQLHKAVGLRAEAYGRHVPSLGNALESVEQLDLSPDSTVILAELKGSGEAVGTMRIQTNFHEPLEFEPAIRLPERFVRKPLATVSRLAVKAGSRGRLVKLTLFKSLYRYCVAKQVEWIMIGARAPLENDYLALGFEDIFDDRLPRLLPTMQDLPHRFLSFEVGDAERRWHAMGHPLYRFMLEEFHPDIEIFNSVSGRPASSRQSRTRQLLDSPLLDYPVV